MDQRRVSELTVDELADIIAQRVAMAVSRQRSEGRPVGRPNRIPKRIGSGADPWGYPFGVEGTICEKEVQRLLGGLSDRSIDERVAGGCFRRGKDRRRNVYCVRSVMEYLSSLEK